jgi:C1A family cysteine protease
MRSLLVAAVLFILPSAAFAQGAILETLDEVRDAGAPISYRGSIPERVDLPSRMPPVRSQAATSTCVSWAATYAAASFALRARGGSNVILSPAFTYNQVSHDQWCRVGTSISSTLKLLRDVGAAPITAFSFDAGWCGRQPTPAELEIAKQYSIKSWTAFDATVIERVKEQLARGVPVIFGMRWSSKMSSLRGETVLKEGDTPGEGHATVVVG